MPINFDKPHLWKADVNASVDLFNQWFMLFAPKAYRDSRAVATVQVEEGIRLTNDLTALTPTVLRQHPGVLQVLRMATCPPLARDRLIGLACASKNLVSVMEEKKAIPLRMPVAILEENLTRIADVLTRMLDVDIFPWITTKQPPTEEERYRASTIVADRLCGAVSDPIVRNAREKRQLDMIGEYLQARGYRLKAIPFNMGNRQKHGLFEKNRGRELRKTEPDCKKPRKIGHSCMLRGLRLKAHPASKPLNQMEPGTFAFRMNVVVGTQRKVNIPIDVVIQRKNPKPSGFPILIEAKSAGDFTNTNKRRKEEATKIAQLHAAHGKDVEFILFLCGYFDSGYLGYEAAEGIGWIWEHRISDLDQLGI
ncbi:MAG: XamI family restriction endonuclease [Isosphaeraceae bacterium]